MSINIKAIILAAAVACLAWAPPANAQGSYAKTAQIWASQGRIPDISVTNSSAATQLPLIGQIARLCNTGSNDAWVAFGSSSITVTAANGSKLVAGTCWGYDLIPFPAPLPFQYVAAITASSTTTIYVETGIGSPPLQIGSSGGSGSNASVGATGATAPTSATLTGMTQGGNLVAMTGTAGNLNVQCANCSGSGVSTGDGAAFVAGTSLFAGGGGFFQTTATSNPLTNGQQGMFQLTANRAIFSNLRNAAGTEIGTAGAPLQVSLANTGANATAVLVNQPTAASLNATVVGTGTFVTQSTLAAETTKVIGTVRNLGNGGAITDFAGQNAASPANSWLIGGQFNTTPTTITTGNASPLQIDANGNLLVNVKAGGAGGGAITAAAGSYALGSLLDGADVTQGAKADAACANGSSACSVNARLAHMENLLNGPQSPTSTIVGSLTPVVCAGVSSCVFANSVGHNLYSAYAECTGACWLMIVNSTTAPSNGTLTAGTASGNYRECVSIPAHDQRSVSYPIFPDNYSVGITAVISNTECPTLTLATTTGIIKGMIQ